MPRCARRPHRTASSFHDASIAGELWENRYRDPVRRVEECATAEWIPEPVLEVASRVDEACEAVLPVRVIIHVARNVRTRLDHGTPSDVATRAQKAIAER